MRYSLASRARARPLVHWPENRIGLGEAGVFLPDVGLISLSFPRVLGLLVLDAGFPFRAQSGSAPDGSGRNRAQASAAMKRRQPFTIASGPAKVLIGTLYDLFCLPANTGNPSGGHEESSAP